MRAALAVTVGLASLAAGAPLASATFPGTNGRLVYEGRGGKHVQLFAIEADGTGARRLTRFADSDAVWGAWSPDGKWIAFERDVYAGGRVGRAAIYVMDADGAGLRVLTPNGLNGRPSWSPDGKHIVYSTLRFGGRSTVSVIGADGGSARVVLSTPLPANGFGQGFGSPTFSPDGRRIAFVWLRKTDSAIFTVDATGGGLKQLTLWKSGVADKIDWSPDGSRVAFSSPPFGSRPGVSSNVFTVRAGGGGVVQLTDSRGGKINDGLDSWSPDGRKLAFASNRGGAYEIYTMNADGSAVTRLTHAGDAHHASWGSQA